MGVMLVYDITNLQTFLSASSAWLGDSYLIRLLGCFISIILS